MTTCIKTRWDNILALLILKIHPQNASSLFKFKICLWKTQTNPSWQIDETAEESLHVSRSGRLKKGNNSEQTWCPRLIFGKYHLWRDLLKGENTSWSLRASKIFFHSMTCNSFIWLTSNFYLFGFSLRYPSTSGKVPELAGTQQMTVKWTNPTCCKNYLQEGTRLVKESPIINGLCSMEDHTKFISVSIFSQSILWSFTMRACSFGVLKTALKIPVQIYANYSSVSTFKYVQTVPWFEKYLVC